MMEMAIPGYEVPNQHDARAELAARAEKDPNGVAAGQPGAKLDAGKTPIYQGVLDYFPRAVEAVASLSAIGAKKYSWKGWKKVSDGVNRYGNALVRHITKESIEGPMDADGFLHATAVAWNALARLELILRAREATPPPISAYNFRPARTMLLGTDEKLSAGKAGVREQMDPVDYTYPHVVNRQTGE